jgi:hypothetical protein
MYPSVFFFFFFDGADIVSVTVQNETNQNIKTDLR